MDTGFGNPKTTINPSSKSPIRPGDDHIPQNEFLANGQFSATVGEQTHNGFPNDMIARGDYPDENIPHESLEIPATVSNPASAPDEEAVLYTDTRMLQDPTGRLLYIGDSAVLSFLQFIRILVEKVSGQSLFTQDPMRHMIVEQIVSLPPNIRQTHLIPDRQTANVLVDSYFTNINGLIEVCDAKTFMMTLDQCYTDPLKIDPDWLCLLHLIFAIGLVMASPIPGSFEDSIIKRLRANPSVDQAEVFYANAKHLNDPSTGFEDSGFWSIQALTLMTVYMLAVSRRNAAYAYHRMAVTSSFALGLHREESMNFFGGAEQSVRRNLWRSLFVLDRFLSTSLGRPTAIREEDCSGNTLLTGERSPFSQAPFPTTANATYTGPNAVGLEASVRSCHAIGVILEKVYLKRKISTKLAQEIAHHCKGWNKALDPSLSHRQARSASPSQGMAILHVNLLDCHSVILLTRPFLIFLMFKKFLSPGESSQRAQTSRMEKLASACVIASTSSIALVQSARECKYLSQRNPFVLYFLFAASLIVLSNEFCGLYQNPDASTSLNQAIGIMHYFSQQDPQARRLLDILDSFHKVVVHRQSVRAQQQGIARSSGVTPHLPPALMDDNIDVMANLTSGDTPHLNSKSVFPSPMPGLHNTRRDSQNMSFSPLSLNAPTSQIDEHLILADQRHSSQSSIDNFFDLVKVSSNTNSGASSEGNGSYSNDEIDFDALWQFPNLNSGVMTPGMVSGVPPAGMLGEPSFMNDMQAFDGDFHAPL
ncbi:uncharacterized protein RCO7_09432 [Rhynchosporium graminicola]|uniref:Xylanolytic transcriptional activator regulatory domain-containing protein n=1 Tax=Rhynchosporium graminicola TaxID=2792576 RepID=A0A1E1K6N6_9HELO|nr:uncharacterized protein RCO7_09432 [Rhynchosporium commune]